MLIRRSLALPNFVALLVLCGLPCLGAKANGATTNAPAIAEVKSGKRNVADAAWWGFSPLDATDSLQAAIDSGAKKVSVPYMGQPWTVRPIRLHGNL